MQLFLMNHTKTKLKKLKTKINFLKIFSQNQFLILEIKLLLSLLREGFSTLKLLNFKNNLFENKFIINSAVETFSWESCNAIRIGYQINEIVQKLNPKIILTTFEGHSWRE